MTPWPVAPVILATRLGAALAQPLPPAPVPAASPAATAAETDPDPESADLSITGSVTYRELSFEQAGTPKVEFSGRVVAPVLGPDAKLHTVWHADRGTLPRPVQTGVPYRDNTVRFTITARFEDLARLFAQDPAVTPPLLAPNRTPDTEQR